MCRMAVGRVTHGLDKTPALGSKERYDRVNTCIIFTPVRLLGH